MVMVVCALVQLDLLGVSWISLFGYVLGLLCTWSLFFVSLVLLISWVIDFGLFGV
jgi:hypothetical protein